MTPDKFTGLVKVVDRGAKAGPTVIKMYPVDVKECFERGGVMKSDGQPRYVLEENYAPDPA